MVSQYLIVNFEWVFYQGGFNRGGAEPTEGSYMFYGYTVDIVAMQNSGKYFLY